MSYIWENMSSLQKNRSGKQREVKQLDIAMVSSSDESEDAFMCTITSSCVQPKVSVQIKQVPVSLVIDSGSSVNQINNDTFKQLQEISHAILLSPSKSKVFLYRTSKPIEMKKSLMLWLDTRNLQSLLPVTKSATQRLHYR